MTDRLEGAGRASRGNAAGLWAAIGAGGVVWAALYGSLPAIAGWVAQDLLRLDVSRPLGSAIGFFVYEAPKVLLLLILVVFGVGVLRSFFTPERTRSMLAGKTEFAGNVLAALLGTVTPFCSCSAVPLFIGFVAAGVPLGVTFSFLVSAPMVNEVALALLFAMFGWKVAALYLVTGLAIAVVSGWTVGRLRMERHVEPWVFETKAGEGAVSGERLVWAGRFRLGLAAVREIFGRVWPFVLVGIGVGAGIHGYVPENFLAAFMGSGAWWSVPLAVLIGVPMYSNAAGIIPVVHALLEKGASLGTVLAFMMAVIALSLPEIIILRKVLKPVLIGTFVGIVAAGIVVVGYLFNLLV
jgi:hypothetical protein